MNTTIVFDGEPNGTLKVLSWMEEAANGDRLEISFSCDLTKEDKTKLIESFRRQAARNGKEVEIAVSGWTAPLTERDN